jgi:hypothetical protein
MMLVDVKVSLVEISAALIRKAMKNPTAAMMASTMSVPSGWLLRVSAPVGSVALRMPPTGPRTPPNPPEVVRVSE